MKFKRLCIFILVIIMVLTSMPFSISSAPTLKEGNYEQWVDRVDDLPKYATDLYDWLVDNSQKDGALRTGVTDTLFPNTTDSYVYYVTNSIKENISFTYPSGYSNEQKFEKLQEISQESIDNVKSEILEYVEAVFAAFKRDNPEFFWVKGSYSCMTYTSFSFSDYTTQYRGIGRYEVKVYFVVKNPTFDIREDNYQSTVLIDNEMLALENRINTILSGDYPQNGTYYDKVKYFNSFLTKTNAFNSSTSLDAIDPSCRNCLAAMYGSKGEKGPVCSSYSEAFKILCDRVGIPCILVDGQANSGGSTDGHMWNYVQMENGKWYAVDVSWNDPLVYGISGVLSGYESEKYFLVGNNTIIDGLAFIESHPPTNCLFVDGLCFTNGPVLSDLTYKEDLKNVEYGKFTKSAVLLGQELSLRFTVEVTGSYSDPYLKVTRNGISTLVECDSSGDGLTYSGKYDLSSPAFIGDSLYVELYSGSTLLDTIEDFSILKYSQVLSQQNISDELRTLLADVIEYGAASQIYSGYKVDDLVNTKVEGLVPTVFSQVTSTDSNVSKSLSAKDYFKFASLSCGNTNNFIFKIITDDISSIDVSINGKFYDGSKFVCENASEGLYSIVSDDLFATQLDNIFKIELYDNDVKIQTLQYSVKSYVYSTQNHQIDGKLSSLATIVRAVYNYGLSSRRYQQSLSN